MNINRDLREALDAELASLPTRAAAPLVAELSSRYRNRTGDSQRFVQSRESALAYAAYRMPATYAAICACLKAVHDRLPGFSPASLLDIGAGPGTSLWAARGMWPALQRATLIEHEESMISFGKALATHSDDETIRQASWLKADVSGRLEASTHDLVVASYVLNELPEGAAVALAGRLWELTAGVLLIIEPGTPAGFSRIRQYRDRLIASGAGVTVPCPHADACPMKQGDWCHFAERIERSRLHREVKAGELAYEDEKFSYIAVSRIQGSAIGGRILRHPQVRPGHIRFEVCTPTGLASTVVTRSERERFKKARDSRWGAVMPE